MATGAGRTNPKKAILPCNVPDSFTTAVNQYAEDLRAAAPDIGSHGFLPDEFEASGMFRAAIERLRGQQAATMEPKRKFIAAVFNFMKVKGAIKEWEYTGARDRYDYRVILPSGKVCIFETKGSLDGNNSNIFQRPNEAEEFIIWSLSQNPGSDPQHNAWSGIHTRLGAEIISRPTSAKVDGVIIWDVLCSGVARDCPKVATNKERLTDIGDGIVLPPPCLYLFPATIPDPRNNPSPRCFNIGEVGFLKAMYDTFKCAPDDVTQVKIETEMRGADLYRRTVLIKSGTEVASSKWTELRRVRTVG